MMRAPLPAGLPRSIGTVRASVDGEIPELDDVSRLRVRRIHGLGAPPVVGVVPDRAEVLRAPGTGVAQPLIGQGEAFAVADLLPDLLPREIHDLLPESWRRRACQRLAAGSTGLALAYPDRHRSSRVRLVKGPAV